MSTTIRDGRIQGQTLQHYVRSQREQTPEVADTIRDCTVSMVDYVKRSLAGEKDADPRVAFRMMDELRDGLRETKRVPTQEFATNQQAATQWTGQANQAFTGTLGGQRFDLARAKDETREGLAQPACADAVRKPEGRVLSSTIHYGDEQVRAQDPVGGNYYSGNDLLTRGRSGLDQTIQQVDELTPLLQAALSNRALRLEEVGHYSETESSQVSSSSASDLEARRKLFGRGDVSQSEASSFDASSQRSVQYSFEPALVNAFKGLQSLRTQLEGVTSFPSQRATITASRPITEELRVETTTVPPKRRLHRAESPVISESTQDARFGSGRTPTYTNRDLGQLPWVPAFITVQA